MSATEFKIAKRIDARRVKALLERLARQNGYDLTSESDGGVTFLAMETGLNYRRVYGFLHGEYNSITFDLLEKVIANVDLDLRWMSKEDGGFGDVYNGEPQTLPPYTEKQLAIAKRTRERRAQKKKEQERELARARRDWKRERVAVA